MTIHRGLEQLDYFPRLVASCILTGGGSKVAGLAEEIPDLPARIVEPA